MATWSHLLRGFFPSWKFFDVTGSEFRLEARFGASESSLGSWTNCLPPISRAVKNIFLNPQANYLHACHNHLSHLNADILACEEPGELAQVATYRITCHLVEFQLRELNLATSPFTYQFRLLVDRSNGQIAEHVIVSALHEA